jgi:tRNA(fMet)-specific endonuclease VapC
MEKMDRNVCLDSDILIEITKGNQEIINSLQKLNANLYASPINIFEIWAGRLKKEEKNIESLIINLRKVDFNSQTAIKAGDIQLLLKEKGELIDFRDLFIASICIVNNLELMTLNKKHFERLTKFGLRLV